MFVITVSSLSDISTILRQQYNTDTLFIRLKAVANSPSVEAVGVGKACIWLTTFRDKMWKSTKRPAYFDAILILSCDQEEKSLLTALPYVIWLPPAEEKALNEWTAPLRCSRPLVLKLPWMLRAGNPQCQTHRAGKRWLNAETRSPLCNYNQIS